ncbi:hypothetical protein [Capnocytophaga endodontalis]|uniref:Toxin-antitoxin system YwqK family antitoxin n=1 Tax=Capnocytophaga endodontalis TaxID=2708117 RepID=A0A1Z4BPK1_9FLAO|nr:hypothetical protein [Capnocytophaga endodontalis]ASF43208.1 hypothetical protein CBG49_09035 [Capnocytophaga endodontalis]
MTKFLTFIALLGGGVLSIAQTILKPSVFIDTKSDDFKKGIVEIKEYTNYEVYQQLQRNLKSGNSAAINADMIRQAFITRKIALQKGTYIIDNNEQHFEFEIGNSGQLVGEGKFVNKKRNIPSTYIFNNGKLAEIHIFTPEGRLRKKNIFKGNTIEGLVYDHAGNIAQKIEIYTNLKEGADQIVTNYHKNGNPSKEINTIKNTTKEYYQNGKLKLEQVNSKTTTKYDPEGKITEKWYVTEKGNCKELYEKGVISQKICEDRSIKETTVSTYKNGKLLETKKL